MGRDETLGAFALAVMAVVVGAVWLAGESEPRDEAAVHTPPAAHVSPPMPPTSGPAQVDASPRAPLNAVGEREPALRDLAVLVRHADGEPAAGAMVKITSDRRLLRAGYADRDGRVTAEGVELAGAVRVRVTGAVLDSHDARFETVDGPLVVTLPDGAEVSGEVRLHGEPLEDEIALALRPKTKGLFGWEVVPSSTGFTTLTRGGRFRISGARAGAEYHLMFPDDLRTPDGEDTFVVEAPATGLIVDLVERPLVRVRLVDEAGRPVAGATATLKTSERFRVGFGNGPPTSGRDGVVEWTPFTNVSPPTLSAVIDARAGDRRARLAVDELRSTRTNDLGDLVLAPGRILELFVEDALGEPVAGARARVTTEAARAEWPRDIPESALSEPSDAEGRIALGPLLDDDAWIDVVSLRHAMTTVRVPPDDVHAAVVTLPPCATLEVLCDVGDPAALAGLAVYLNAEGASVVDALGLELRETLGGPEARFSGDGGEVYGFEARERLELVDVTPDVPIAVSITHGWEDVLWGPTTVTLAPGEHRRLTIDYDPAELGPLWTLRGRVVASDGESPGHVRVQVLTDELRDSTYMLMGGGFFGGSTFDIDGVRGERVEVAIDGDDFVDRRVWVERTDERVDFVMERGREVEVHVVDVSGAPVGGLRVSARTADGVEVADAGSIFGASPPYTLTGVPPEPVTLEIQGLGRTWTAEHDASSPRADVVLDGVGSLALTWTDVSGQRVVVKAEHPDTGDSAWFCMVDTDDLVAGRIVLDAVAVGRYRVTLSSFSDGALTEPRVVDVTAGRTTVALTPKEHGG